MMTSLSARLLTAAPLALLVSGLLLAPLSASAKNSVSRGHGVKCTWVLVKSVNGVNTYKQVCRKGP